MQTIVPGQIGISPEGRCLDLEFLSLKSSIVCTSTFCFGICMNKSILCLSSTYATFGTCNFSNVNYSKGFDEMAVVLRSMPRTSFRVLVIG